VTLTLSSIQRLKSLDRLFPAVDRVEISAYSLCEDA
jgi:hypothetical protein